MTKTKPDLNRWYWRWFPQLANLMWIVSRAVTGRSWAGGGNPQEPWFNQWRRP